MALWDAFSVTIVTPDGIVYDNIGFQTADDAWGAAQYAVSTNGYTDYTITVKDAAGDVVRTETVKSEPGGPGEGPGGLEGEGGAGEAGGGEGQPADMGFRFRLTGWKWTWDSQPPVTGGSASWTGHGEDYDIQASDYTYGSAADALSAGKALGDANTAVLWVYAESNYPGQFAGSQHHYEQRDTDAKNAPAAEQNAAIETYWTTQGTLKLKDGGTVAGGATVGGDAWNDIIAISAGVMFAVVIVVLAWYMLKGRAA